MKKGGELEADVAGGPLLLHLGLDATARPPHLRCTCTVRDGSFCGLQEAARFVGLPPLFLRVRRAIACISILDAVGVGIGFSCQHSWSLEAFYYTELEEAGRGETPGSRPLANRKLSAAANRAERGGWRKSSR